MPVVSTPCPGAVILEGVFTASELSNLVDQVAGWTGRGSLAAPIVAELGAVADFATTEPSAWALQPGYTPWASGPPSGVRTIDGIDNATLNSLGDRAGVHVPTVEPLGDGGALGFALARAYVFTGTSPSIVILPDGAPDPGVMWPTSGACPPPEARAFPYLDEMPDLPAVTSIEVDAVPGRVLVLLSNVPRAVKSASSTRRIVEVGITYA